MIYYLYFGQVFKIDLTCRAIRRFPNAKCEANRRYLEDYTIGITYSLMPSGSKVLIIQTKKKKIYVRPWLAGLCVVKI